MIYRDSVGRLIVDAPSEPEQTAEAILEPYADDTQIRFTVYGLAVPKGSMKAFVPKGWTRAVITHDNKESVKNWSQSVAGAALAARGNAPMFEACGLTVTMRFCLPRPQSLAKKVARCFRRPDADKLSRLVCDACTGILWRDDAQIDTLLVQKVYAGGEHDPQGAHGTPRCDVMVMVTDDGHG